jgi:glycosyltransferase involved in cell wall biosynthesis
MRAALRLIRRCKKNQIDLIHANGSRACFYAGLTGRVLGIPVIWHVRETVKDIFYYDALLALFSSTIICVSKSVQKKRFLRFRNHFRNKIQVIYNGVDTFQFQRNEDFRFKIREELVIEGDKILFGIIGNIIPLKGQDFFLKGFAKAINKKTDLLAKVLIVGRIIDYSFNNKLREFISDMDLENHVIFRNYNEKIIEIFSALDVFVLTSQREGFSRSLLEAMSSGLPVLATKLSEIGEAIINGENGLLVDYNDVDKLASAIIKLSEDSELRRKMGLLCRKRAVEGFDLKSHSNSVENIYNQTLFK